MLNVLKIRLLTLQDFFEQYQRAEGNPHLQNAIVGAMRYECDKLNLSVVDYINEQQAKRQNLSAEVGKAAGKEVAYSNGSPVAPIPASVYVPPIQTFICEQCGREFATQKALSGHQKAHRIPAKVPLSAPG